MVWPIFAIALAGLLAAPAGAVAYGFRRPVLDTRRPEIFLVAAVIRNYRERGSFWFMLYHGFWRVIRDKRRENWNKKLLEQIGLSPFEIRQILSIYDGLEPGLGKFQATACCVEIVRNLKAREKRIAAAAAPATKTGRDKKI